MLNGNMETLTEKLYNNNVIFSYYGFIDHTVLEQVLRITRSKLESQHESLLVITRPVAWKPRCAITSCPIWADMSVSGARTPWRARSTARQGPATTATTTSTRYRRRRRGADHAVRP